jgi:hypothetical protein
MNEYIDFPTNNTNLLFNKNKISADIASLSSMSSISSSSSVRSAEPKKQKKTQVQQPQLNIVKKGKKYESSAEDEDEDDDQTIDDSDNEDERSSKDEDEEGSDDEEEGSEIDDEEEDDDDEGGGRKKQSSKLNTYRNEINEKKEILYQLNRLEHKGFSIPHTFNMQSDLEEMKQEYNKIIRDKEIDASVRFQRKMLMAFVTGTEYLNTRYDPFAIKLEGWSEQVHENLQDFDDIFEELHDKYKSKGKSMPPELRLFVSLSGSAFMFHLTSKMFKESSIPGVEEVLKANPELMKQFQNAAAKQFIYNNIGNNSASSQQKQPIKQNSGGGGGGNDGGVNSLFGNSSGLFGMVNNLFSGLNRNQPPPPIVHSRPEQDINKIINNVHNKISIYPDEDTKIETLSISDEEITSIIEDATDVKILKSNTRGRKPANSRTLNI